MKKSGIFLVLLGTIFLSGTGHAQPVPDSSEIQKAVMQPEIKVGEYELDKDGLTAFYAARNNRAAWNFSGAENAATFTAFVDSVDKLIQYHGLRPEDYALEALRKSTPDGEPMLELLVTDTLLKLAHDLHGDAVDLDQLYPGWSFHRHEADIPAGLAEAVTNNRLAEYIDSLIPKNPAYAQLADTLRTYHGFKEHDWPVVESGSTLRLHDHGRRVTELGARLEAEDYLPHGESKSVFDEELRVALTDWQSRHGLEPVGQVGAKTFESLNISLQIRIDQIHANMERWRHMPEDFPPARYALVNIPDMTIDIVEGGLHAYQGPVVVGRVDRKTPFIQSEIRSMIVNPSWHVPAKIAQKDILPKLRKDPHYLEKLGFIIKGNEDDPYGEHIDWASMPARAFDLRLRQSPGDMNSLGRLKFDFDNDFAVYMHGTPHQELFDKPARALSSGCVRLRDPEEVAEILLASNKEPWSNDRIEQEIGAEKTKWVGIRKPMPVYFVYWTVFADEDGKTNFRSDIYDYDRFLMETLSGDAKLDKSN